MIEVLLPGARATIQDAGRVRGLRDGVPTAGPADRVAHATANALVGNDPGAAAIEIVGLPFVCRATRPLLVAAAGRDVRLVVRDTVPGWTCAFVRAGDEVRVEGRSRYAYLAIAGGIDVPAALGSRSSYPQASLGPAALAAGARVRTLTVPAEVARAGATAAAPDYAAVPRVVVGPHEDRVDARAFLAASFVVDERSDRMGVRLRGEPLPTRGGELVTAGMAEGAVQVPGGGEPIVLLADHQTTGGYPVVATVIAADLPLVAQREPGEEIRFAPISLRDAVAELQRVRYRVFAVRDARSD